MACMSEPPLTFQPDKNVWVSNQYQPKVAIARMGISASAMVQLSSAPITRGPRMFANVSNQITPAVAITLNGGALSAGMSSARYPVAATAMAMLPIQLPNQ